MARTITRIAAVIAVAVATILPAGYFFLSYQNQAGELDAEVEINGRLASEIISANPEMWRFQEAKLEEFLSGRPRHGAAEIRRILDLDNNIVAERADAVHSPLLTRSAELLDSGLAVGRIEIGRSLLPLLLQTAGVALFGLLLSLGVFATLKISPLHALDRALADNTRLYKETLERAEKLETFNELARVITSSLSTQEVFDFVVRSAAQLLNAKMVRIWAEDKNAQGFVVQAIFGMEPETLEQHTWVRTIRPGEGVVGEIIESRRAEYIRDVRQEPRWLNKHMADSLGLVSFAGVPVVMGDRVLGVLTIMTGEAREFSDDEREVLKGFADQAAVAIENARLYEETTRHGREAEELARVARSLTETLDMAAVGERIVASVRELLSVSASTLRLLQPDGSLRTLASAGQAFPTSSGEDALPARTGLAGRAIAEGRPVWAADVLNDPGIRLTDKMRDYQLRSGNRSMIAVPLRAREKIIGVLVLLDQTGRMYAGSEVALVQTFADQAALALENARLFEETHRNLKGIRALREIDMAITSTLDLRAVLDVLLEKIDLFLPYSTATVRLLGRESRLLEPVACRNLDEKEWKAAAWRPGRGPANVVFESEAPLMIRNCLNDPRVKDPEFFRKHQLISYLGVPMVARAEILGVLSFYTKEEHEFTGEEIEFLAALAGQAAIAIHNSQVYEEMTKLAADLSRANKAKDEFLSVMSHELRTPLNVVMGYTGLMKDRLLGEINLEQEQALDKVISRVREQLTMISSMLQAVHMEAEGLKVESRAVNLKDFLDDLSVNYKSLAKELDVVWDYSPDLPVIHTDGEKLKQVLENLIANAIKFTEKGAVTVSARYLAGAGADEKEPWRQGGDGRNGLVRFKVADTGIGIANENLSRIFERFWQVDSSETRRYGGVGIGLYIVKKFTELLGGKVEVESELEKGSTFTVTIPCATSLPQPAAGDSVESNSRGRDQRI